MGVRGEHDDGKCGKGDPPNLLEHRRRHLGDSTTLRLLRILCEFIATPPTAHVDLQTLGSARLSKIPDSGAILQKGLDRRLFPLSTVRDAPDPPTKHARERHHNRTPKHLWSLWIGQGNEQHALTKLNKNGRGPGSEHLRLFMEFAVQAK